MASAKTGGGSATQLGISLQNRVAAWIECHVLAERSITSWGMPADALPQVVRCETEYPVDDIFVGFITSSGALGRFFVQVKRNPLLSQEPGSALASFFSQAVRQYLASQDTPAAMGRGGPLDVNCDRIVLAVNGDTSETVAVYLREMLHKLRELGPNEPLVKAGEKNQKHATALQATGKHVAAAWLKEKGSEPTDNEIRDVLRFIHVELLDIEEDRPAEREAKNILRYSLPSSASAGQIDHAWRVLQDLAASWASRSSGGELPTIQHALLKAGVTLKEPPSVRPLVDAVKQHSARELQSLRSDFARLKPSPKDEDAFTIRRTCMQEMLRMASEGSFLIVGEPGAGKSGAQYELASQLMPDYDVVVLRADRPREFWAPPLRDLDQLVELLERWPGNKAGILIIDALDAARAETENLFLREMIIRVAKIGHAHAGRSWHVVASIRKFDLRYGEKFQEIFRGSPSSQFCDEEFRRVRHLNMSLLDVAELNQVWDRSPQMEELYKLLNEETQRVLRNPFYLSLAALLLSDGLSPTDLGQVRSRLELLDRYWRRRVIRESGGDGREKVLRVATRRMVDTRRLLVERREVVDAVPTLTMQLDDLLHHGVLCEFASEGDVKPLREILSFPHHLLFDAAIERLELRVSAESLVARIGHDPELAIVIRPSFGMHFHYLWERNADRREFWKTVLLIAGQMEMHQIAKVMGPAAAADLFRSLADIQPLREALQCSNNIQNAAFDVIRHFIGAALAMDDPLKLMGPSAAPWAAVAAAFARSLDEKILPSIINLLLRLTMEPKKLTPTQLAEAGEAARSAFQFMLKQSTWHSQLWIPVQLVCRTFDSNYPASENLLRTCFKPEFVRDSGHVLLPRMAHEIAWLKSDPAFVKDLYVTVFTYDEDRTDTTSFGGTVLPMTSNRKQDYNGARYALNEAFAKYLHDAPAHAFQAALVAVAHSIEKRPRTGGKPPVRPFYVRGHATGLILDFSSIWDQGKSHRGYEATSMLDDIEEYLGELSGDKTQLPLLRSLIEIISSKPRHAVWWRRLLRIATEYPDSLGLELRELATIRPLLTSLDTVYETASLLSRLFPLLSPEEQKNIERTVLALTAEDCPDITVERVRGQILAALPTECLTLPELQELQNHNEVRNEPHFQVGRAQVTPYTEEDWLKDRGVNLEAPATQALRNAIKPVRDFCSNFESMPVTPEAAASVVSSLESLLVAIGSADENSLDQHVLRTGWSALAEACERLAGSAFCDNNTKLLGLVCQVLLDSTSNLYPRASQSDAANDASLVATGPRYSAAGGLIALIVQRHCINQQFLNELQRLSVDPAASVRIRVAQDLDELARALPDYAWQIIEERAKNEVNPLALSALIGSISHLANSEPSRVMAVLLTVFNRAQEFPVARRNPVPKACGALALWFWLNRGDERAKKVVDAIIRQPADAPEAVHDLIVSLREGLTRGDVSQADPIAGLWRERAFGFLESSLKFAESTWNSLVEQHQSEQSPELKETLLVSARAAAQAVNTIGYELFFASGAYEHRGVNSSGATRELKKRFLKEASSLIDALASVGFSSVAHNLVQTLGFLADADPTWVLKLVAKVVEGGAKSGYQNDSLAAKEVVNIIECYLAQYKHVFHDNPECRQSLINILDRFIEADWPEARRLTYQLEDVYR